MMNYKWEPLIINLPMKEAFTRKSADRQSWIPVVITNDGLVSPIEYHGSAHISALTLAKGIIAMQAGKKSIEKGEVVGVRQV